MTINTAEFFIDLYILIKKVTKSICFHHIQLNLQKGQKLHTPVNVNTSNTKSEIHGQRIYIYFLLNSQREIEFFS